MVDTNLFRYIMKKNGDSMESLAMALGVSRTSLSLKINNKSEFRLREICAISQRYNLTLHQVDQLFCMRLSQ